MASRWFRVKEEGTGSQGDEYYPKHVHDLELSYCCVKDAENSPVMICHVFGDEGDLDTLANKSGVVSLDNVPTQALERLTGRTNPRDGWDSEFSVGSR